MKDYYQILGVPDTSTDAEISKAFRKRAASLHPDRHGKATEAQFKAVAEAYHVLRDEKQRAEYDRMRADVNTKVHEVSKVTDVVSPRQRNQHSPTRINIDDVMPRYNYDRRPEKILNTFLVTGICSMTLVFVQAIRSGAEQDKAKSVVIDKIHDIQNKVQATINDGKCGDKERQSFSANCSNLNTECEKTPIYVKECKNEVTQCVQFVENQCKQKSQLPLGNL